jgi:hypothetical protein
MCAFRRGRFQWYLLGCSRILAPGSYSTFSIGAGIFGTPAGRNPRTDQLGREKVQQASSSKASRVNVDDRTMETEVREQVWKPVCRRCIKSPAPSHISKETGKSTRESVSLRDS